MAKKKINYSLRPAKNIERKMICEALRRLTEFRLVETYRYIGFGAYYFSDFILFHKALNLKSMISIEKDIERKERYIGNRPFNCIEVLFGNSDQILKQKIKWNEPTITWLDYDGDLTPQVLSDIQTVCTSTVSGSILIITVNAHPGDFSPQEGRLERLSKKVGEENIPSGTSEKDLAGWGTASVLRKIIQNKILETISRRNGGLRDGYKLLYNQLFNFHYADDAKMLTVGGLLVEEGQKHIVNSCAFESLPFVKKDDDFYRIEVPYLTYRELRDLSTQFPVSNYQDLSLLKMKYEDLTEDLKKEIQFYSSVYRYFPTFAEADL